MHPAVAQVVLAESALPAWVVLPLAGAALLVAAWHWWTVQTTPMPRPRRMIRGASTLLMMALIGALAVGAGLADPSDVRTFALAWMLVGAILLIVLLLAVADVVFTMSLLRRDRQALREEMAALRALAMTRRAAPLAEQPGE